MNATFGDDKAASNETRRLADLLLSMSDDEVRLEGEERAACRFAAELIREVFEPVVRYRESAWPDR